MTLDTIRTLAEYRIGSDLAERIAHAEDIIRQQREGLAWAADEIERLLQEQVKLVRRCRDAKPRPSTRPGSARRGGND